MRPALSVGSKDADSQQTRQQLIMAAGVGDSARIDDKNRGSIGQHR
jgi:hypothetical protein